MPLGAASCRQVIAIEERSACDGADSPFASCSQCAAESCCDELLATDADEAASRVDECLSTCGGGHECRAECRAKHASIFNAPLNDLLACESRACAEQCAMPCGGYVYPDHECAKCAARAETCCLAAAACSKNAECLALSSCAWGCNPTDYGCKGDCVRKHRGGEAQARALSECVAVHCTEKCPG